MTISTPPTRKGAILRSAEGAEQDKLPRWPLAVALVLCLGGVGVSIQLTYIHYFTHTDPAYHSVCAIDEQINCETVAQSPYSVFLGLPVSAWGAIVYLLMGVLALWGLTSRRLHPAWPRGILLVVAVAGVAAAALLAYISFALIQALCIFCLALYGINAFLLAASIAALKTGKTGPLSAVAADLIALARRPLAALAVAAPLAGSIAAALVLVPPYWHHPGWQELPQLPTGVTDDGHHWIGAVDPLVEVVEFSDYQCPYCRRAHKNMRTTAAVFPDTVRLTHYHVPLDHHCNPDVKDPFHERACEFARAVACAGEQGKFWEMNDAVFSVQEKVSTSSVDLERLAEQIGTDPAKLTRCMKQGRVQRAIKADMQEAERRKIVGTPTYFIQGQPFPGGISEGILRLNVETARERQRKQEGAGR
jgi:protein-disulfide isomerase/uncharacterized membrane protein